MHFRNLALFLWGPDKKSTDVLARHFAAQWAPPSKPPGLDDLIDRVSREVAHLTTRRLSGRHKEKEWQPLACIRALLPALQAFVQQADAAKLSPNVSQEVGRLRSLLDGARIILGTTNLTTTTTRPLGLHP